MTGFYGFRTITKCFIRRYVLAGTPPVQTPKPLSILIPPSDVELDPGVNLGELKQRTCTGPLQTAFTFPEETLPKLKLTFDTVGPELEQLIHGRVVKSVANAPTHVLFHVVATNTTIAAKATGEHGGQVTAQTAESGATAYYIDPATRLSKEIAIVDADPTGDEMVIGAGLAITLSPELAATGYTIYGRVPVVAANATVMSNEIMGLVGVFLTGVTFDGLAKEFSAHQCSLDYGASLTADSKRTINLRILPYGGSRSGLGWDIEDIALKVVC
jgi:hypothetical protein